MRPSASPITDLVLSPCIWTRRALATTTTASWRARSRMSTPTIWSSTPRRPSSTPASRPSGPSSAWAAAAGTTTPLPVWTRPA
ncbi:hypothetical protein VTK73DRAFT_9115 [Phialemonium thermophilum]|uniref:Uncharacterized protein n=1 Tax=Phialemonium thermophilum TaxID=223376 RepID=A0ABR3W4I8_9PEZI